LNSAKTKTAVKKAVKTDKKRLAKAKKAEKKDKKRVKAAKSKGAKKRAHAAVKRTVKRVNHLKKKISSLKKKLGHAIHHLHKHHHHSHRSQKESDLIASILKLGRRTWHNSVWTHIAVGKDTMSFMSQSSMAEKALEESVHAAAPILRNPNGHFSMSALKGMKGKMDAAYAKSLRAEEAVLMSQGRMQVAHKSNMVPHGIVSKHISAHIKAHKKVVKKIVKKLKAKVNKKADAVAKKLTKKAAHAHKLTPQKKK
jgi:hypothetical protein